MGYYGGRRRRYNPRAEERRERERKDEESIKRDRARLARLLKIYRLVPVKGEESKRAWAGEAVRSFSVGKTYQGDWIPETIRRANGHYYLQRAGVMGWDFYRLVPRYHVLRHGEGERDQHMRRRRKTGRGHSTRSRSRKRYRS